MTSLLSAHALSKFKVDERDNIIITLFQLSSVVTCRLLSSHHITKNIELISQDKDVISRGGNNLQLNAPKDRPLLVILSWLLSKRKHIMKFTNFYMEQGFDVVTVSISPWQLIWPTKGSRVSSLK